MSERTVQQWLDRYAEVQAAYAVEMEREGETGIAPPSHVFWDHDDALAELAHMAATIFTLEREQGRLT